MKILMNAEAFGFGPSAMIAKIFNEMNIHQTMPDKYPFQYPNSFHYQLDYVGSGHTLDLQRKLPYHAIYDVSDELLFKALVVQYDCFITALDFEKARWARDMEVDVIIYDNLTWYWRKFPDIIDDCHYIAHQFYGVKERLEAEKVQHYHLVSPFSGLSQDNDNNDNRYHRDNKNKRTILVNFGGLENPLWDSSVTIAYVQSLLSLIVPLFKTHYAPLGYRLQILASKTHRDALLSHTSTTVLSADGISYISYSDSISISIDTFSRQDVEALLPDVAFAFMTPGLGNIIDSATYGMPVCFLPPANDSQGWQLDILKEKGLVQQFAHLDWNHFFEKIDYTQPQKLVLDTIRHYIVAFHEVCQIQRNHPLKLQIQLLLDTHMKQLWHDAQQASFVSPLEALKSDLSEDCHAHGATEIILSVLYDIYLQKHSRLYSKTDLHLEQERNKNMINQIYENIHTYMLHSPGHELNELKQLKHTIKQKQRKQKKYLMDKATDNDLITS
jgi:hypothetical protein